MLVSRPVIRGSKPMSRPYFSRVSRRRFLQSTGLGAVAVAGLVNAPVVARAQAAAVKVGVLHPVSGPLSYSGQQGRLGASMAIDEINAAGGVQAVGGGQLGGGAGERA